MRFRLSNSTKNLFFWFLGKKLLLLLLLVISEQKFAAGLIEQATAAQAEDPLTRLRCN